MMWLRVARTGALGGLVAGAVFGGVLTAAPDPHSYLAGDDSPVGALLGMPIGAAVGLVTALIAAAAFGIIAGGTGLLDNATVAKRRAPATAVGAFVQGLLALAAGWFLPLSVHAAPVALVIAGAGAAAGVASILFSRYGLEPVYDELDRGRQ